MIKKIHHVGIAVRNLEEALPFYRDVLQLPVELSATLEEFKVRLAFLTAGEGKIELVEPLSPEVRSGRFLQERGEGLYHVALETDDIVSEVERFRSRGAEVVGEIFGDPGGTRGCYLRARGGVVWIELMQPGPPS